MIEDNFESRRNNHFILKALKRSDNKYYSLCTTNEKGWPEVSLFADNLPQVHSELKVLFQEDCKTMGFAKEDVGIVGWYNTYNLNHSQREENKIHLEIFIVKQADKVYDAYKRVLEARPEQINNKFGLRALLQTCSIIINP